MSRTLPAISILSFLGAESSNVYIAGFLVGRLLALGILTSRGSKGQRRWGVECFWRAGQVSQASVRRPGKAHDCISGLCTALPYIWLPCIPSISIMLGIFFRMEEGATSTMGAFSISRRGASFKGGNHYSLYVVFGEHMVCMEDDLPSSG
ncbi:hypothetical protein TNCT_54191 [Trichonephila clavata]|uniref:Uncharacterized protein n=1 Tax=Trichonephila clavata TaxID=2740835 RepID=A0A8X6LNG6_TRICU|nr:hypothetical protein TNCT_54191 [Trichonephila clavata]